MPSGTAVLNVHVVSHTHWDREWYLTREQFRLRLVALVDRLLDLMESGPEFQYFHLDGQTIVLEDYLELRPRQEPRLRKLIGEGRILVGPWYDMPDEFLVSGESLIRNLALGQRIARGFGGSMPVGYLPDLFGHVGQMPQILRHFGLDNAILWRGFGGRKAEYWWEAPDGSRVLMLHLPPEGYCNATRVHFKPDVMVERSRAAVQAEAERSAFGEVLLMNGVDHVQPHPVIPELIRRLSEVHGVHARHSTLPAYVDAIRTAIRGSADRGAGLETVRGELRSGEDYASLLPGVLSARVSLKQANARVQTALERWAEPLSTFASMLGAPYPADEIRYAWRTLLQNHPHDSICGCSIDAVHEENMTRFARAGEVADAVTESALTVIARAVPAPAPGVWRAVAMNPLAQAFRGVIEAVVDLPFESAEPRRRVDPEALDAPVAFWPRGARLTSVRAHDDRARPFQVLAEEVVTTFVMSRFETPWALRARRLRVAWWGEISACGYATFDLALADSDGPEANASGPRWPADSRASRAVTTTDRSAENEFVRLSINDDGTVDVVDRRHGTRYVRCGELEDVGDVGDEYNYSPPRNDRRLTSADATAVRISRVQAGPVRAAFRVDLALCVPAGATGDRSGRQTDLESLSVSTVVTLDAGSPRVGWHVTVENRCRDHRLRVLFPVGAGAIAEVRAETAFGVAHRPPRRQVPVQVLGEMPVSSAPMIAFVEAGDERAGGIIYGEGLMEYEAMAPGEGGGGVRVGVTLLRCVGDLSRDDLVTRPAGHAGPGLATPGAQCLGRHEFRLAFEPRGAPPAPAALFACAASFMAPPRVVAAIGAGGGMPASASFLRLEPVGGAAVVSACKQADDRETTMVRLFNPEDTPASVRVRCHAPITGAFMVDFLEERRQDLPLGDGAVEVTLDPHRIETIELVLAT